MKKKLFWPLFAGLISITLTTIAQAQNWAFDVYLDQSRIGKHTFSLNQNNQLISQAKFNVKVLFIDAYQYEHTAKEQWKLGCLQTLQAKTVENKVETLVKASNNAGYFKINQPQQSEILGDCVMTFAYWNPKILDQTQLLNPQNGEYLDISVQKLSNESIQVKGQLTQATHYRLTGKKEGIPKLNIELWYSLNNDWLALKSTTPEGYNIIYKLI